MHAPAPPFHEWLRSQLSGAAPEHRAVVKRFRHNTKLGQYPQLPRLEQVGHYFGASPDWIVQWKAEAIQHWGIHADMQLSLAGLRQAERWPCVDCDETFYKSDWKRGSRRCRRCQRRRGTGSQRRIPKNPLAQYLLAKMNQRGIRGVDLSRGIGRNDHWFTVGCGRSTWHPRKADLEATARLIDDDADNLIRVVGMTWEQSSHLRGKRVQILRLATQVDRAKGDGSRECYRVIALRIRSEPDIEALDRIREALLSEVREPNREGLRKMGETNRGRARSPEASAKASATMKKIMLSLSPDERRESSAHLRTTTATIRRGISLYGRDRVFADIDGYAERAAAYTQLPVASVRPIIRAVLGMSGRPSQYSHPDICKARGEGRTWSMLGGENPRIAHRQWHRLHHVPSCSPAPP